MSNRAAYFRAYHLRNRDKRLAQMAARYVPRTRRPPSSQTDAQRRAREQAYRARWRVERKLCKHLGITMQQARRMTDEHGP